MTQRVPKPEPVVVTTICSLCDQPWEDHGDNPTTADCIRLLKAELLTRAQTVVYRDQWPTWWQYPNYVKPLGNTWTPPATYPTVTCEATSGYMAMYDACQVSDTTILEFRRPDDDDDGLGPVAAIT